MDNSRMIKFKEGINPSLKRYIEQKVIPQYNFFDDAHGPQHARDVIERALSFAKSYPEVNPNIIYVSAAMHDLGLCGPRESHHILSGKIIREDKRLSEWFNPEEIEIIAQAAEDHRASLEREPRTIEGKIISEADRIIDPYKTIARCKAYNNGNRERVWNFLRSKYGKGGYIKAWLPETQKQLREFQRVLENRKVFDKIFDEV